MEENDNRADNPYTTMEGYVVYDVSGREVGRVASTVYDAPSDVLKYVVVNGRAVLADRMKVDPEEECVSLPYEASTMESAPRMEQFSGAFDDAVREHYEGHL